MSAAMHASSDNHHTHTHDCACQSTAASVHQTLDEMDFERGIWSSCVNGDTADVLLRLQKGDDVNATDKSGYTGLHYASRNGHVKICELLLSYGAKVNAATKFGQATPLHRAAFTGRMDVLQLLLRNGANPLLADDDGITPLHKAAEKGHTAAVEELLRAGPAAVKMMDKKGRTPLNCAMDSTITKMLEAAQNK